MIKDVLNYWFGEIRETEEYLKERSKLWFGGGEKADTEIRERFGKLWEELAAGQHEEWAIHPTGRLATIIVLDQFSRNLFRKQPKAFSQDGKALKLAWDGIEANMDKLLHPIQRIFFYMPFEHSEDPTVQQRCLDLFAQLLHVSPEPIKPAIEENLDYAVRHFDVIKHFGRFPHRNEILGRVSTPEEIEFLTTPGSSF